MQRVKKASQSLPPAGGKGILIIFCRGVYLTENTTQAASVRFVRQRRTNRARGRMQSFCQKRAKPFFDSLGSPFGRAVTEKRRDCEDRPVTVPFRAGEHAGVGISRMKGATCRPAPEISLLYKQSMGGYRFPVPFNREIPAAGKRLPRNNTMSEGALRRRISI